MGPPLNSPEGMQQLADWARAGGWVLQQYHEKLAKKHGVSLDGIVIARPIPEKADG